MRIRAEGLCYAYPGGPPIFENLDWTIEAGSLWFVVGPSGSGKTTWLRLCLGLVRPTMGRLVVGDLEIGRASAAAIRRLRLQTGMVFQDFRLLADQSAFDNVAVALRMAGTAGPEVAERTRAALAEVGLAAWADRPVSTLSWGQQQRVAFARAWVRRPRLFLADEPTGNLDQQTADALMDLVARMHAAGCTVIVTTHDVRQVERLGGRVMELRLPATDGPAPSGGAEPPQARRHEADGVGAGREGGCP